jgi:hypothetical protein
MGMPSALGGAQVDSQAARKRTPRRAPLLAVYWMVCQYSRAGPVSSEKHGVTPGPEVEGRGGPTVVVETAIFVGVCDGSQPEPLSVNSLRAKLKKSLELRKLWRLYVYETLLEGLAQDLQDVAAELRQFIQIRLQEIGTFMRPPLFVARRRFSQLPR